MHRLDDENLKANDISEITRLHPKDIAATWIDTKPRMTAVAAPEMDPGDRCSAVRESASVKSEHEVEPEPESEKLRQFVRQNSFPAELCRFSGGVRALFDARELSGLPFVRDEKLNIR